MPSKPSKSDRDRAKRLTPKGPNAHLSKNARPRPRVPGSGGDDPRPWTSTSINLPANHGWRGKEGHKIFIADRGAFRVDYPADFHVVPQEDKSIALMDAPTSEKCSVRLKVTLFHLPAMDYSGLPLDGLIRDCVLKDDPEAYREITGKDPESRAQYDPQIHTGGRDGLEYAWVQGTWIDDETGRPITTRSLFARGHIVRTTQALCTYDVYTDRAGDFEEFWVTILETMQLGQYYSSPNGPRLM